MRSQAALMFATFSVARLTNSGGTPRAAKLSGGVAVIKVGASTEIEMKEKKARV